MEDEEREDGVIDVEGEYSALQADRLAHSSEAQNQALSAASDIGDKYLKPHEGFDARNALIEFDKRDKESLAAIRRSYKGDPAGFSRFMATHGKSTQQKRKHLEQLVAAEMKHGSVVLMKTMNDSKFDALIENDNLKSASVTVNQALDNEVASESMDSALSAADSEHEFAKERLEEARDAELAAAETDDDKARITADYDAKIAAVDTAVTGARAVIGDTAIGQLTNISQYEERAARQRAGSLRNDFRRIFLETYKSYKAMNQGDEIAYANALESTRKGALKYFTERIKGGQVASVLYLLDELEKTGVDSYKKTIDSEKNPTGTYDPSYFGFVRRSDISALRKVAQLQIAEAERKRKLTLAADKAEQKLLQDKLDSAVNAWKGNVVLKIAGGALSSMDDPQKMLQSLLPEIAKFQEVNIGGKKVRYEKIDTLVSDITAACEKYVKMRDDARKSVSEATEAERKGLLRTRYNELRASTLDNVEAVFTTPNGKMYKAQNVERRAALIATIDAMLSDESTPDALKSQLKADREKFKTERDKRNAGALEMLAKRVGWKLPTEQTAAIRNYRAGEFQIIDGAPSYQTGDDLLFNDKGQVQMGSGMKARWVDPDDPSSTLELGRNEVRSIFQMVLTELEETPEDDFAALSDPKSKSRVETLFLNAMRGAKRRSDSASAYSAIASSIRKGEKSLFELPTSTRRMSYISANYVIPPLPVKKTQPAVATKPKK